MRASIVSFLACRPADLAKWRTRLGSTITTSRPASRNRRRPALLVAAAGLQHRLADAVLLQPRHQLATALGGVGKRRFRPAIGSPHRSFLGDIDADKLVLLCHPPAPFLARSGFEPVQLFGFKEDTAPVPRSATGFGLRDLRAQMRRRAAASTAARSHILPKRPDTRDLLSAISRKSLRKGPSTAPRFARLRSGRRSLSNPVLRPAHQPWASPRRMSGQQRQFRRAARRMLSAMRPATSLAWVEIMKCAAASTVSNVPLQAPGQRCVDALHRRMALPAAQHQGRQVDRRERRRSERESRSRWPNRGYSPASSARRSCAPWPARRRRCRRRRRSRSSRRSLRGCRREVRDVGVGHAPERLVVLVLAAARAAARRRRLDRSSGWRARDPVAQRDGERHEAAERMADQMHRPAGLARPPPRRCRPRARSRDLLRCAARPFRRSPSRLVVTRAEAALPGGDHRPPGGAGAARSRHQHHSRAIAALVVVDPTACVFDHGRVLSVGD